MVKPMFRSLFPTPFGYVNYGESNRELNKKIIKDIDKERIMSDGKKRTFSKNPCGWQSDNNMEIKYESFIELSKLISNSEILSILSVILKSDNFGSQLNYFSLLVFL